MRQFLKLIEQYDLELEKDEGYIADIPDLKYCSAFGETPAQALAALSPCNLPNLISQMVASADC